MIYIYAFLFVGILSLIGQIIVDNTKLTPGHVTSLFVLIGAVLSFFGIYEVLIKYAGVGASVPITSFGNSLFKGMKEGFQEKNIIGIFSNGLKYASSGLIASICFSFICSLFSKVKD